MNGNGKSQEAALDRCRRRRVRDLHHSGSKFFVGAKFYLDEIRHHRNELASIRQHLNHLPQQQWRVHAEKLVELGYFLSPCVSNSGRQGYLRAMVETYREAAQSISTDQIQYSQVVSYDRATGTMGHEVLQSTAPVRCRILRDGASQRVTRWKQTAERGPEPVSSVVFDQSYDANAEICRSLYAVTANGQTSFRGAIRNEGYSLQSPYF